MSDSAFSVVVEPETLRPGRSGPATGSLWVVFGKEPFPLMGWNDFVVVMLEALASAVQRIVSGAPQKEIVHFMEGPFELHLEGNGPGWLRVSAVERGRGTALVVDTSEDDVIEAVLSAVVSILEACRSKACWSVEADGLEMARAVLASASKRSSAKST